MDGVLWKDATPIGDLARIFDRLRADGLKVTLATNNGMVTVEQHLSKLAGFGVRLEPWQVVTSPLAAATIMAQHFPDKGAVYIVGESGIVSTICEAGFRVITDPGDATPVVAVVASMDRDFTYQKLNRAMTHIRAGARFYGTNPDVTFPVPGGLVPGAGSIIAAVQAASATAPTIIGKPSPYMYKVCAERMGLEMQEILGVGDRLETDIAGAQAVGARSGLVLSGVSTREQAERWKPQIDVIAPDLTALVGA